MEEFACSFSGHRALSAPVERALIPLLDQTIDSLFREGYTVFYCGGAVGFDSLAAERVLSFRESHPEIRLSLILPCKDQDSLWKKADRDRYDAILARADSVSYVAEHYNDRCMKMRNDRLALYCDALVCYVTREGTGSSQTMRAAKQNQRRVINLADQIETVPG